MQNKFKRELKRLNKFLVNVKRMKIKPGHYSFWNEYNNPLTFAVDYRRGFSILDRGYRYIPASGTLCKYINEWASNEMFETGLAA
ncbi:MAG: hypothetical protein ACRCX2_36420 [Paraclostridium sp.]